MTTRSGGDRWHPPRTFPGRAFLVLLPWLLGFPVLAGPAHAAGDDLESRRIRHLGEFDRLLLDELGRENPEAVPLFLEANTDRQKDLHQEAAVLYARVAEMAPRFDHALRRQCGEEMALGDRARALLTCRRAVAMNDSPWNRSALAMALIGGDGGSRPTERERTEALGLAWQAADAMPQEASLQFALCQAGTETQDPSALKRCAGRLETLAPDEPGTHYFVFVAAAVEGRFGDARAALDHAHELGLPEDQYRDLLRSLREATPLTARILPLAETAGVAWLGGMGLLFVVGLALSQVALRAARRPPAEGHGRAAGLDAVVRRTYAIVLWLCCGYYYLSIPALILVILLAGGGIIYATFVLGHIPVKLVVIVLFLMGTSLWAILRSLFLRASREEPGRRLTLDEHPEFAGLLQEVAGKVATRPVDAVYMTPGTEVAVMERGGLLRQLTGRTERCLLLGAGVLPGMRLDGFRAVLAHEYGHLSNRDTAGGRFALAVRRSLMTMAGVMAEKGAAQVYNPAWLFVIGFHRIFLRISQGATRLQEVLADRWAAAIYGAPAFETGLRHVVGRGVRFSAHADATIREVVDRKQALSNLYSYAPTRPPDAGPLDATVAEAVIGKPSPYDSHPPPAERFTYVRQVPTTNVVEQPDGDREVWSLFHDRDALEMEMTARIRGDILARYGVAIPGGEVTADQPRAG